MSENSPSRELAYIVSIDQFENCSIEEIGGKAKGIAVLHDTGLQVPQCFCIVSLAFDNFVAECIGQLVLTNTQEFETDQDIVNVSNIIVSRLSANALPENLVTQIESAVDNLKTVSRATSFIVRSSSSSEDSVPSMAAGQYLSVRNLRSLVEIVAGVKDVWLSAFTPNALIYRKNIGLPLFRVKMAVVVQAEIASAVGGVLYTFDPENNNPGIIRIEYVNEHPSKVVNNECLTSQYLIDKVSCSPVSHYVQAQDQTIGTEYIQTLCNGAKMLEQDGKHPVDVEWIISTNDELYWLQCRAVSFKKSYDFSDNIVSVAKNNLYSPKLLPFQIQTQAGVSPQQAHVVTPLAFEKYLANKQQLPLDLVNELGEIFESYCKNGPISIRPTYWSAKHSANMMPQSPKIYDVKACFAATEYFWNYIIQRNLNDYSAEVAFLVANWVDVAACANAATGLHAGRPSILIESLYGYLEGLENNPHDITIFDLETMSVVKEDTAYKTHAVFEPNQNPTDISTTDRATPVLDKKTKCLIAEYVKKINEAFGPTRVEVLIPRAENNRYANPVFWQIDLDSKASFEQKIYTLVAASNNQYPKKVVEGKLKIINRLAEVESVTANEYIVLIDTRKSFMRDPALVAGVVVRLRRCEATIVVVGSQLSHLAATLREYCIRFYCVNRIDEDLVEGEKVQLVDVS